MVVGAGAERTRAMTDTAVLEGRHMVGRFTACRDAMAGGAVVHDAGMVDESSGEAVGVVAHAAVFDRDRVGRYR